MSALDISLSLQDFDGIQDTLSALDPVTLDKLLQATVNQVANWSGTQIDNRIAAELGIPKRLLKGRMVRNRSDNRKHDIRSSWLWYGGHRISAGTLLKRLGLSPKYQLGKVQVGNFTWRRGFALPGRENSIMQREGVDRYPISAAMVDVSPLIDQAIQSVEPLIASKLQSVFIKKLDQLLSS